MSFKLSAQLQAGSVKMTRTLVGLSAISVDSIFATSYKLPYPLFDFESDSSTQRIFFSARQGGEANLNSALSRGLFASLNCNSDSVDWLMESGLYHLDVIEKNLLMSNDVRTVKYNKLHGYDEVRYDSKLIYFVPRHNKGFFYDKNQANVLHCVNLGTGLTSFTCTVPMAEDWVDARMLNDSVLLIAAGGLHALDMRKGLLWSIPMGTIVKTNRSFTYSLAKYNTIAKISTVVQTAKEQNQVTQIASNILIGNRIIYFVGKEKMIAADFKGQLLWQLDLRNYPTSKMYISKTDTSLVLVNFGLATHSHNFVTWGKPFIITLDQYSGRILDQFNLSHIENLADFVQTKNALIFAGKDGILKAQPGTELKTMLELGSKYGQFVEFIDGDAFYIFKEGYYVPLNFINDNLIYFKTDNNKVYGIDGDELTYEYHYTELFQLNKKYQDKTILVNDGKTILTSQNFELLFTINLPYKNTIQNNKMYFMAPNNIFRVNLLELK